MRVDGLGRTVSGPGAGGGRAALGGFRLADHAQADQPRAASPLRSAPAPDALMALQSFEETPVERRRRALKRGRGLLDALDGLKLAMVEGGRDLSALATLSRRLAERRDASDDAGLDDALSAIELRVAVELAKRGR